MNLLCEHALINAYVDHVQPVPMHIVAEVAREFQFDDIKPVATSVDSRDARDSNLIVLESKLADSLASPPEASVLPCKEQSHALTTRASVPFGFSDNVPNPIKESPASTLDNGETPASIGGAETSKSRDSQITGLAPSMPGRIATSQSRGLTGFLADLGIRPISELATKPTLFALPPPLHEIEAKKACELLQASNRARACDSREFSRPPVKVGATKSAPFRTNLIKIIAFRLFLVRGSTTWRNRFLRLFTPPHHNRGTAIVILRSKQSLHLAVGLYRACRTWRNRCSTIFGAIDWPQTKASACRWLRRPWKPTRWRLSDLRLFQAARGTIHKKA